MEEASSPVLVQPCEVVHIFKYVNSSSRIKETAEIQTDIKGKKCDSLQRDYIYNVYTSKRLN